LSDRQEPAGIQRRETSTSGGVVGWNLNDEMWARLTREDAGDMLLSGKAAARLLNARRDMARAVNQARGQEARFGLVVPAYRDEPALTRFELYWETLERVLADRPLTILDPQSTGRTHLFLADPERFNLNPMTIPQLSAPAGASAGESPPGGRP
jgi:hypothetical protein